MSAVSQIWGLKLSLVPFKHIEIACYFDNSSCSVIVVKMAGGGSALNIFKLNRGDAPKEVLNWRLWFAVFSFGLMGAARGIDEVCQPTQTLFTYI